MVKIRLMRVGKKKQPSYRVVVADARSPRDGRIIEALGHYHPRSEPSEITIDNDRAVYWLRNGAQPSEAVRKLLQLSGAWSAYTGEAAPAALQQPEKPARRATPAASVKATPAADLGQKGGESDEPEAAELPEAVDQAGAAPDADEPTES